MSCPRLFSSFTLATAMSTFPSASAQEAGEYGFQLGQRIPALELPTLDGSSTVRLSELRGKRLLLIQFASW